MSMSSNLHINKGDSLEVRSIIITQDNGEKVITLGIKNEIEDSVIFIHESLAEELYFEIASALLENIDKLKVEREDEILGLA